MEHRRGAERINDTGSRLGRRMRGALAVIVPAAGLALALVVAAPVGGAVAQQNIGGGINIGGSIADTVASAVSGISSEARGGVQSSHSELDFGEQEGLAISDASGGNTNVSVKSR